MIDECLLDVGQASVLRVPLDGPDPLSVKGRGAVDAGPHGPAGSVGLVDDHHAGMADADAAAELRAGQAEMVVAGNRPSPGRPESYEARFAAR